MESTQFLIIVSIWYIIGFISITYLITKDDDLTITDLIFNSFISFAGVILLLFVLIDKYGDTIIIKKSKNKKQKT